MLSEILELQRHRLFLWVPVFFGIGIAIYFSIWQEPSVRQVYAISVLGGVFLFGFRFPALTIRMPLLGLALICLGFSFSAYKTHSAEAPVLGFRYYGPIEGTITAIDRSASNALRITLENVFLAGVGSGPTPTKIRVSLQGFIPDNAVFAGARVTLTGSLSPPGAPVEPNGFDFRRMAWFMQLGAVGYTRNPVIPAEGGVTEGFEFHVFNVRMQLSTYIQTHIDGQNGAFAAAILTGDRSGIDPAVLDNLRAANLAHLLAISGLHMGLLSGFVFGLIRYGLALILLLALTIQPKKVAAVIAILAGAAYLILSGANVATQRAFIMTLVVLVAVILDRPAFTLRGVALAAMIVLLIKPYSLLEAGFQMSFAATTALISVFEWLRGTKFWQSLRYGRRKYFQPVLALFVTSFVAGLATAPISAFHFNQISHYGLFANLLAVPVMGLIVIPSAVIAGILSIVNLDPYVLTVLGKAVGYILKVAQVFSQIDGSLSFVKSTHPFVLGILILSGIIGVIWKGRLKLISLSLVVFSTFYWITDIRPEVLITEDAKLFGVTSDEGRVISKPRGSGYSVNIWLENDGDPESQPIAAARDGLVKGQKLVYFDSISGWRIIQYSGKDSQKAFDLCEFETILMTSKIDRPTGDCIAFDADTMKVSGAVSIHFADGLPEITGSRERAANRPWGQ